MTRLLEHIPTDMTVTVDATMTLAELQTQVAKGGQWLPIDPPSPHNLTIADLLARNLSGPRRFGYGTVRDYVIGLKAQLADGRIIKNGGKVVKNVAGYDLLKLFIGAENTLGAIVETTFKLRPLPEVEEFTQRSCQSLQEAGEVINAVLDCPVTPTILDLHRVNTNSLIVVLGFDGDKADVDWQRSEARKLGFVETANLDYEKTFWAAQPDAVRKKSVLPSRLMEAIAQNGDQNFVARAGNGILCYRGAAPVREPNVPVHLWKRVKAAFDPNGILPSLPS